MSDVIQGKNVVLKIFNLDGYYALICAQTVSIKINVEQLPATAVNGGGARAFKPGKYTWTMDLSGVLAIAPGNFNGFDMTTEQARLNGFDLLIRFTSNAGDTRDYFGHANPSSTEQTGTVGSMAKFSVTFQGTGAFSFVTPYPSINSNDVNAYYYFATGSEPNHFNDDTLKNRTILAVFRDRPLKIKTSGTPGIQEVLYTAGTGVFTFDTGSPLSPLEEIMVLWK